MSKNKSEKFVVSDKLSLAERCEYIRQVLHKFTKTQVRNGIISNQQKEKLFRDDLISTVKFLDKLNVTIEGKDLDTSGLERGVKKLLSDEAKEARECNDKDALKIIAEQEQKLTMRENVYKTKQREIAFGRRLLDFIGKYRELPTTRHDFEMFLKQFPNDFEYITRSKTAYNDCYRHYGINEYISNQRNR